MCVCQVTSFEKKIAMVMFIFAICRHDYRWHQTSAEMYHREYILTVCQLARNLPSLVIYCTRPSWLMAWQKVDICRKGNKALQNYSKLIVCIPMVMLTMSSFVFGRKNKLGRLCDRILGPLHYEIDYWMHFRTNPELSALNFNKFEQCGARSW